MRSLHVHSLIPRKALIARSSARQMAASLESAILASTGTLELDFQGVEAVAPSFVDETLGVIQEIVDRSGIGLDRIVVLHPPTRLSSAFHAIGRGRDLVLEERSDGAWVITPRLAPDTGTRNA